MKLLVSDYDGTFNKGIKNLYLNISAIDKFRENGNIFALSTGRSFKSIKKEIMDFDIKYDYLMCNNGLITFDKYDNIVNSKLLKQEEAQCLINKLLFNDDVNFINYYGLYDKIYTSENLLELKAYFKSKKLSKKYEKNINLSDSFLAIRYQKVLYIASKYDKSSAISFLKEYLQIDSDSVYTVGDSINDLTMLKNFNGYKMINSSKEVIFKNIPVTTNVHKLLRKIK